MSGAAACPWDPERMAMAASSPARARAIINILLQQGELTLGIMQATENSGMVEEWRRAAHGLAGVALNLGMDDLAQCCREDTESTATAQQRSELRARIHNELERIRIYKLTMEH